MRRSSVFLVGVCAAIIGVLAGSRVGFLRSSALPQPATTVSTTGVARLFASHLNDPAGHPNSLLQWQGKTLVVNFWATWCPPCREEMPAFSRLQERYAAQGVQFVGIALDSVENVRTYHALSPVSYPLLIGGPEGGALARDLGNASLSLPYTVVINPQGEVRLMQMGALAESDLERILARTAER